MDKEAGGQGDRCMFGAHTVLVDKWHQHIRELTHAGPDSTELEKQSASTTSGHTMTKCQNWSNLTKATPTMAVETQSQRASSHKHKTILN